jgi:hypothetical protein
MSNYSELYTLYSFDSNNFDGIEFLEASGKQEGKAEQRNDNGGGAGKLI